MPGVHNVEIEFLPGVFEINHTYNVVIYFLPIPLSFNVTFTPAKITVNVTKVSVLLDYYYVVNMRIWTNETILFEKAQVLNSATSSMIPWHAGYNNYTCYIPISLLPYSQKVVNITFMEGK